MDKLQNPTLVKYVVKLMNLILFLRRPRQFTNYRWGDILADSAWNAFDFARNQFYRVYLRVSNKYRYHPQQMKHSAQRNIDPSEPLAKRMAANGTGEYYNALPSTRNALKVNHRADLSTHKHSESLRGMVDSVKKLADATIPEFAQLAAEQVLNGLTREVIVDDREDWQQLRLQLRDMNPAVKLNPDSITHDVFPFAVSYKAKEETYISNITLRRRDEEADEDVDEKVEMTEKMIRTSDFLNDRRWEQIQRAVQQYARAKGYQRVCLWVDRLINLEKSDKYAKLNWVDFGLYPYMLMPTVRVYEPSEMEFGTSFWRKVEATLAVSGKGLICDDYMIRKFDTGLFYDQSLYGRLINGIIVLGGKTAYVRSTILAFATMIITDGIAIYKMNEHPNTRSSIVQWKSWAIRCITEDAFSHAPAVPICNAPVTLDLNGFKLLSSFEYDLCHSKELTGGSYLDMTIQRSICWGKASAWNGISEWIGMMGNAFAMDKNDQNAVMSYLNTNTAIAMYAAPSGHTAAILSLKNKEGEILKSLVVDTARFSTSTYGYVTAVADATGHGGKRLMPWYLKLEPNPDGDQNVTIEEGQVQYNYRPMKAVLAMPQWLFVALIIILNIALVAATFGIWLLILIPILLWKMSWPWADYVDVGEALFDNLLLHSLFGSGIKQIFREVHSSDYRSIQWN